MKGRTDTTAEKHKKDERGTVGKKNPKISYFGTRGPVFGTEKEGEKEEIP